MWGVALHFRTGVEKIYHYSKHEFIYAKTNVVTIPQQVNMVQKQPRLDKKIKVCLKYLNVYKMICLRAVDLSQNIKRYYTIHIHKNLFQDITVSLYYGHIGRGGQLKYYHFSTMDQIEPFLKPILKRRLNAKKRIGVNYKLDCKYVKDGSVTKNFWK